MQPAIEYEDSEVMFDPMLLPGYAEAVRIAKESFEKSRDDRQKSNDEWQKSQDEWKKSQDEWKKSHEIKKENRSWLQRIFSKP